MSNIGSKRGPLTKSDHQTTYMGKFCRAGCNMQIIIISKVTINMSHTHTHIFTYMHTLIHTNEQHIEYICGLPPAYTTKIPPSNYCKVNYGK